MAALVMVVTLGTLLVLFGVAIGAGWQDKINEGYRRRAAIQRREINARWRALQGRNSALELALLGHQVVMPIALERDDSD